MVSFEEFPTPVTVDTMADMDYGSVSTSEGLDNALQAHAAFLLSDDAEREAAIEGSGADRMAALADDIDLLYDEINSLLDRLVGFPHPLPTDQERLEDQLNSLAQAGIEARMELDRRS